MVEKFVARQKELLALEREAELAEAAQLLELVPLRELCQRGVALQRLGVAVVRTGLYGRTLVSFVSGAELPAHTITSGDIVGMREQSGDAGKPLASGVVVEVKSSSLTVAFDESWDSPELEELKNTTSNCVCLTKMANDVTYRRLLQALQRIETNSSHILTNILLGISEPSVPHSSLPPRLLDTGGTELRWMNCGLDDSQRAAVCFALQQRELAIIHGPPGTGKTTTVVEVICQAVKAGDKVLVCAPSNVAVDNLLERLVRQKVKCIRLGHPARVSTELQQHSLEALVATSDQAQIVRDIYAEIDGLLSGRGGSNKGKEQRGRLRNEIRELRKELKERERRALKEILMKAEVILGTLTSAGHDSPLKHLPENHFSLTVIDECSQSLEMACWAVVPWSGKLLLAGDHLQLPPTILSTKATKELELTLMERLLQRPNSEAMVRMLTTQYRMHAHIMTWSSEALYDGRLRAGAHVAGHVLADLEHVRRDELTETVLLLIDTAGCDMTEFTTADGVSKGNEGEAALVCHQVSRLVAAGLKPADIAVITPYNLQVELIRMNLKTTCPAAVASGVEVRSVDGYQGREKEVVILSLVRSNLDREVGFLAERRRLNVAVTRARRQVTVICDSETVGKDTFLRQFLNYLEAHGTLESASLYADNLPEIVRPKDAPLAVSVRGREAALSAEGKVGSSSGTEERRKVMPKNGGKKQENAAAAKKPAPLVAASLPDGPKLPASRTEPAQDDLEDIAVELRDQVARFVSCDELVLHFSCELSSHHRRLVHELAEEQGLMHESQGEGRARHIVLRKPNLKEQVKEAAPPSAAAVTDSLDASMLVCNECSKSVSKSNMGLHKLRCRVNPITPPAPAAGKADNGQKTKKSSKLKKPANSAVTGADEDFDAVCAQFQTLASVCNYERCKTKTAVLGANCAHCRGRFCLSHALAEIHGCGEAAKLAARQQLFREKVVNPGSGSISRAVDPTKRAQLKKKLDKKLDSLSSGRKPQKNSDQ